MTIAIIITTKEQPQFLTRQLAYLAKAGSNHSIFISDLGDAKHLKTTLESLDQFKDQLKINHIQLPGVNEYKAIEEISERIDEPYVALASDDSFLIPGTLEDCASFLDAHPDYNSAYGVAISFVIGLDQAFGEIVQTRHCPQRPVESVNGRMRLLELLSSYWPARLGVQRTHNFREAATLSAKPTDTDFRELISSCIPIIRGKSKQIDRLYSMRQAHVSYYSPPYALDWVTDPKWLESYSIFDRRLKEGLIRQDKVDIDEAEEVVKEGFRSYMTQRMAKGRIGPVRSVPPAPIRPWRRAGGAVPGIRRTWQLGRKLGQAILSVNPPGPDKLSLSALLRPSSAYHADFMPVYLAITTPVDVL